MTEKFSELDTRDLLLEEGGAGILGPLVRRSASVSTGTPAASVGEIVGFAGSAPIVATRGSAGSAAVVARSVVGLGAGHIGHEVLLVFEGNDPARPIVVGVIRSDLVLEESTIPALEVEADGRTLAVTAKNQLVLRCGKASITLTRAGKVLISGEYIVTASRGVNRVRGGSVQIN